MKVALVHDYLREYGGAERVLEVLHEIYPEAPVYVAYYNEDALVTKGDAFRGWDIRSSWLKYLPFANKLISPFRIFAPFIFRNFDLSEYDLVISSCNIYFSKAVKVKKGALHLSYIHTPPRYLYGYATSYNYKKHWWSRIGGEIANHFLRIVDYEVSQRPDILIANSKNVAERIRKFYRRDSVVIYPPVILSETKDIYSSPSPQNDKKKKSYFLTVGRLVRGKGIDLIIEACGKLRLPLKVAGSGPEFENFKFQISNFKFKNIELLGAVSDGELVGLYTAAKATILASEDEDFGIVPVESMVAGTPVIAPRAGGYMETIIDGKTGTLFEIDSGQVTVESLINGIKRFNEFNFKPEGCRKQAEKFSKERFKKEVIELIEANLHT
ncbi:hypothetical protein A2769_03990 [Candidatus Daviesbacteria bacterium RIFCSPHIGHO2_01_FULL_37_27]|nr:MAG: hypothetical protein A2769_03990 [Candidatus Daviesbacteria bacterium RIFCSPHIGHO2_01_FULL_37_27]